MSVTGHITCHLMPLILARFHPPLQDRLPAPAWIKRAQHRAGNC